MKSIKQMIAAAAVSTVAFTAFATTASDSGVTVRYGDLNLQNEAGAEVLYRRLESAVRHVCGATHVRQPIGVRQAREECVRQKLDMAVQAVDSELVTRIHQS